MTTARWRDLELPVERRFEGVRSHVPIDSVRAAIDAVEDADALVALGGGSAIDTAKAVSAETGLPVVSVPTTYSGAEWTPSFGMRDEARALKTGGSGASLAGIVYEPRLTLGLPRAESGGTAMNALAHCAEALYARGRTEEAASRKTSSTRSPPRRPFAPGLARIRGRRRRGRSLRCSDRSGRRRRKGRQVAVS